jgi:hypothetical protein
MTDDPRDLLTEAAPRPAQPVDLGRVVTTARRRRVRTRALAAAASVVVVAALVVGATSLSSGSDSTVAVHAGTPTTSDTPAGWTRVTVDGAGISIAIPPGWQHRERQSGSALIIAVGTSDSTANGGPLPCRGDEVALYQATPGLAAVPEVGVPNQLTVVPRPDFTQAGTPSVIECAGEGSLTFSPEQLISIAFTDSGRTFIAHVSASGDSPDVLQLGRQVLNTLRVEPLNDASTSTTAPATTTLPGVPTSIDVKQEGTNGGGFFNATTTDERQIQQAFLGWLNGKNLDQAAPWIEDFASMRDSEAQGFAQHTPQEIEGYGGQVESVTVADPTHADVVYTLLYDGQPMYANRAGKAVKVGGKWLVTRDTACGLLSLGGITCPARTTPTP